MLPGHDARPLVREFARQVARAFRAVPSLVSSIGALQTSGGTVTGPLIMLGASIIESEGPDVAAAATTNIWANTGNTVHVTGSGGPITSLGTAPQIGSTKRVIFDGTPILTQSANLNLNANGQNIQVEAGDFLIAYADTLTQIDCFLIRYNGLSPSFASQTGNGRKIARTDGTSVSWTDAVTVGTPVSSASQTSIDFSIPTTARWLRVYFNGFSTNGTSNPRVQLGTGGAPEVTGYLGSSSAMSGATSSINFTAGFDMNSEASAAAVLHGTMYIDLMDPTTFTWQATMNIGQSNTARSMVLGGSKSLAGLLNLVRITTANGTDQIDAGKINVSYL